MRIDEDLKLDFKDVLIRPKRSTLRSRADVDISREYQFKHSKLKWSGVPIIASNMDHTGTFEMAKVLSQSQLMTAVHKFMTPDQWQDFQKHHKDVVKHCFVSSGISDSDFELLKATLKNTVTDFICLDVANGYSQHFVDFVKKVRDTFPAKTIMAGNVVTGEMAEELIIAGADIVKAGCRGGCCRGSPRANDRL